MAITSNAPCAYPTNEPKPLSELYTGWQEMLCQQFLPIGYMIMRRLVVRVPDAGVFPIQRILVEKEALLHAVAKCTGAAV